MTEACLSSQSSSSFCCWTAAENGKPIPCQIITVETSNPDVPVEELDIKPCSAEGCAQPVAPAVPPEKST